MWCIYDEEISPRELPDAPAVAEMDAGTFAIERLGLTPHPRQLEVLRSTAKRGILNCSRQWGKSTMIAAKAVHRAYTRPGSTILVASPTERQSAEFVRKARQHIRTLRLRPRRDPDNRLSVALPNGSRIIGLPGTADTVRGYSSVSMLLIDEASRVQDEAYRSLRPSLAVGDGDLWLMSTPRGQRGFFYETWRNGENWLRVSVTAEECPWIKKEWLHEERRDSSADWFAQEYMCSFTSGDGQIFSRDLVESAFDSSITELRIERLSARG